MMPPPLASSATQPAHLDQTPPEHLPSSASAGNRAVVIMSGGGAVSPFTTPDQACTTGLPAGNTDTAIREYLLGRGKQVFTAPASDTWGEVQEPDPQSFGAFGGSPRTLPEHLTVMSTGSVESGGERLARFLRFLHDEYQITDLDLVGHSNGGLFARAAIRIMRQTAAPLTVHSLTMLGTPHEGAFSSRYATGEIGLDQCAGDEFCIRFNQDWLDYAGAADKGLNAENTHKFLTGPDGWNAAQAGYLDGIALTLLAGTHFQNDQGDPELWPYDGLVGEYSALARGVPTDVLPGRICWSAPLTHSIFVSDFACLPWDTALTWNESSLARIDEAIETADARLGS
ncbi:MAG: esterase/lipase family protein [Candidatus Nanopelagicales bacterium]